MLSKLKPYFFARIFKEINSIWNGLLNHSLEAKGQSDNWWFGVRKENFFQKKELNLFNPRNFEAHFDNSLTKNWRKMRKFWKTNFLEWWINLKILHNFSIVRSRVNYLSLVEELYNFVVQLWNMSVWGHSVWINL